MDEFAKDLIEEAKKNLWDNTFLEVAKTIANNSHCVGKKVCCLLVKDGQIISSGINGTLEGLKNCDDIFSPHKKEILIGQDTGKILDKHTPNETLTEGYLTMTHHEWSKMNEVHAEQNAIARAAKRGINVDGATAYITLSPCSSCALLLAASGIKRVVIKNIYNHEPKAFEILKKVNIEVTILEN
jgi:dCMP deaminase